MPRYHFNVDDDQSHRNEEGVELPSLAEAKCQAVRYAGNLICDRSGDFWDRGEFAMTVTDENGLMLFSLQFIGTDAPAIRSSAA
ncbi:uncharacterized protein DUF6894 [Sphingomonas sp. F9_3S_D5_B_2]